jgi:organic radical activating enzyme/SAM-dependent methyltransferase
MADRSVYLKTGSFCNNRCVFCPETDRNSIVPLDDILLCMETLKKEGFNRLILTGGEPLIRKDILKIFSSIAESSLDAGVVTNGRMLCYQKVCDALLKYGVKIIITGLHSHKKEIHDRITGVPGSFEQTAAGIKNLSVSQQIDLIIRPVITSINASDIADFPLFLQKITNEKTQILFAYQETLRNEKELFLSAEQAESAIRRGIEGCMDAGFACGFEGMPHCMLKNFSSIREEQAMRIFSGAMKQDSCIPDPSLIEFSKLLQCSECVADHVCHGIYKSCGIDSDKVLPIRGVRSNSFDYMEKSCIDGFLPRKRNCKGSSFKIQGTKDRNLFLSEDKKIVLYHTDTGDFSDEEISTVKRERCQIYADISSKLQLDDFQKDVRQLRILETCMVCSRRNSCPQVYEVIADEVPFEREERWIRQELRRMNGKVLDVGCGDLRYQDIIRKLTESNEIEYHGLDPDINAILRLKKSGIKMIMHNLPVEKFIFRHGYFDYVLILRSFNHFEDLDRTFEILCGLMRNNAQLIMADCIPFALLRSRKKISAARSSLVPQFEHFRNWDSEMVLEYLKSRKFSLRLDTHRKVSPKTSNQWILKMIKIEEI